MKNNNPFLRKIEIKNKGYIKYNDLYETIDIVDVFVEEEYRNQKVGSNLLEMLIKIAKKNNKINITLEVSKENKIAIKLYKKYNFKEVAIRKGYYKGIDGILMELEL